MHSYQEKLEQQMQFCQFLHYKLTEQTLDDERKEDLALKINAVLANLEIMYNSVHDEHSGHDQPHDAIHEEIHHDSIFQKILNNNIKKKTTFSILSDYDLFQVFCYNLHPNFIPINKNITIQGRLVTAYYLQNKRHNQNYMQSSLDARGSVEHNNKNESEKIECLNVELLKLANNALTDINIYNILGSNLITFYHELFLERFILRAKNELRLNVSHLNSHEIEIFLSENYNFKSLAEITQIHPANSSGTLTTFSDPPLYPSSYSSASFGEFDCNIDIELLLRTPSRTPRSSPSQHIAQVHGPLNDSGQQDHEGMFPPMIDFPTPITSSPVTQHPISSVSMFPAPPKEQIHKVYVRSFMTT